MGEGKAPHAVGQARNIVSNGNVAWCCLLGYGQHDGQKILGAVSKLAHEHANMVLAPR
jgi:hypothetical protein